MFWAASSQSGGRLNNQYINYFVSKQIIYCDLQWIPLAWQFHCWLSLERVVWDCQRVYDFHLHSFLHVPPQMQKFCTLVHLRKDPGHLISCICIAYHFYSFFVCFIEVLAPVHKGRCQYSLFIKSVSEIPVTLQNGQAWLFLWHLWLCTCWWLVLSSFHSNVVLIYCVGMFIKISLCMHDRDSIMLIVTKGTIYI